MATESDVEKINKEIKSLGAQNKKLSEDIEELEKQIQLTKSQNAEYETKIKKFNTELNDQKKKYTDEIAALKAQLSQKKTDVKSLQIEIESYQKRFDELTDNKSGSSTSSGSMSFEKALKILGLSKSANEDEVTNAISDLSFRFGPVFYDGPDAAKKLDEIQKAGDVVLARLRK